MGFYSEVHKRLKYTKITYHNYPPRITLTRLDAMSIFKKTSEEEVNAALGDVQDAPQAAPEAAPAPPPPAPARQTTKSGNRTQQAEDLLGECLDEFRALGRGRTLQKKIAAFLS